VASTLTCRKTLSTETGCVYAWETGDGVAGNLLVETEGAVARPCTPQGVVVGGMLLRQTVGSVEQPDANPDARRCFLSAASVIFQEWQRQGRLPEKVTRTYW
jgi:hypothetical protein